MIIPEDSQPISITPTPRRVRAIHAGHVIADSEAALVVRAPGLPARHYFPIDDVEMGYLGRTGHVVDDAQLGGAAAYTLTMEGDILEDVAWLAEEPAPAADVLRGRIAFDPRRIEVYEIDDGDLASSDGEHPPTRLTAI